MLMRKAHIQRVIRKKYKVQTTDSMHLYTLTENLLNRDFSANKLGQKRVSDLTYIRTDQGWLHLTTVLDLADRKIIGWAGLEDGCKEQGDYQSIDISLRPRCNPS